MTNEQIHELLKAVDTANETALETAFDTDIILIFGNQDPIKGRDEVLETFRSTSDTFEAIHHELHGVWMGVWDKGEVRSVECTANYTRKDGNTISLPVTSTLRLTKEGRIADYRIFMDASPAFA